MPKIGSTAKRKWHFIDMADDDMEMMARLTHGITNHAPTGEHNRRFFLEKPTDCPTCKPKVLHSREHILTCCRYVFSFPSMRFWKNNKNNDKMLKKIIKENSTIFSFEDLPPDVLYHKYSFSFYLTHTFLLMTSYYVNAHEHHLIMWLVPY